jgi:protein-tyrosine-phosphatase
MFPVSTNKTVIFVCTSNTCRSPMASALANQYFKRLGVDYKAISRGISTEYEPQDSPASKYSVECLLEEYDMNISSHRSKILTQDDVDIAFAICGLTQRHNKIVSSLYTNCEHKLIFLDEDVIDPWKQPKSAYSLCAASIQRLLPRLLDRMVYS